MRLRIAGLLVLGGIGAAAAWLLTRGDSGPASVGELVATFRGGTPAPELVLPEALRPRAGAVPRPPSARFLLDASRPLEPRELASGLDVVEDLAFTPDGRHLLSVGYGDFTLRVWDVRSGEPLQAVRLDRRPRSVALAPGGDSVIVADVYDNLRLFPWHPSGRLGWSRIRALDDVLGPEIAVSPDGHLLATSLWRSAEAGELALLRLADLSVLARATVGAGLRRPAFSPSGRWLAAGSSANTFTLWDLTTGKGRTHVVPRVDAQSDVGSVAFSPDERLLATGHMDSSITIWTVEGPSQRHNFYVPHASTWRVAFAPAGSLLATGQQDGGIYLWDPESARPLATLRGHSGSVREVAWSADGSQLASCGEDGRLLIWGERAPSEAPLADAGAAPAPAAEAMSDADVVRLLAKVRRMEELPADQRTALAAAAERLPQMSPEEKAAFGLALALAAEGRELGEALAAGLRDALGQSAGSDVAADAAGTVHLDQERLAFNLEHLPEARPLVEGLRALERGELAGIEGVLTEAARAGVARDRGSALDELRARWEALRRGLGSGPLHVSFAGDERRGVLFLVGSSGALAPQGYPGVVEVRGVPVVLEDGAWRFAMAEP